MTEDRLQRRLNRAKQARKEAEQLLEEKSRELFLRNQELEQLSKTLEQKVLERTDDLKRARDHALKATQAKSHFIANMSHEIRTPLNGVLGILEMLRDKCSEDEQQQLVNIATRSGRHLLQVVNEVLDFSKIEAGELSIHLEPVNILKELDTVMTPMQTVAESKDIHLSIVLPGKFPKLVELDSLRFRQIVNNILSNAIKFTETGTISLLLEKIEHDQFLLRISDTGIGMTVEQIDHVFSDFVQADSSISRKFGGTGLGLAITQKLVILMGGEISVNSKPGVGSTFEIKLPLREVKPKVAKPDAPITREIKFHPRTILLVEDVEVNAMISTYMLEKAGLKVIHCDNGPDSIRMVEEVNPDVVLMDIQMPEMDGLEATRRIRDLDSSKAEVPIIAMTGHATEEHRVIALKAGMHDQVNKPIDIVDLYTKLSRFIPVAE